MQGESVDYSVRKYKYHRTPTLYNKATMEIRIIVEACNMTNITKEDEVGEDGASWRTGQHDESTLVSTIITILLLSVCHTC